MSAGRQAAARPKWRQRQIRASVADKEARRIRARGQRMRIEVAEPRIEALCRSVQSILRLTGQPVPPDLAAACETPSLVLLARRGA